MAVKLQHGAISAAEYHKMREAGIQGEDEHVEMLNGEVIKTSLIQGKDSACVERISAIQVYRIL